VERRAPTPSRSRTRSARSADGRPLGHVLGDHFRDDVFVGKTVFARLDSDFRKETKAVKVAPIQRALGARFGGLVVRVKKQSRINDLLQAAFVAFRHRLLAFVLARNENEPKELAFCVRAAFDHREFSVDRFAVAGSGAPQDAVRSVAVTQLHLQGENGPGGDQVGAAVVRKVRHGCSPLELGVKSRFF
jgi:hypothetical protein